MKITNYNEFLLEKEFQKILETIKLISEADTYSIGDTIEWDLTKDKGVTDEPAPEMEWTFEPKKSKIQTGREKLDKFADWLKRGDTEKGLGIESKLLDKIDNFLKKVKDSDKIKQYFIRILDEIKSLPENIKRDLLKKVMIVLAVYMPLSNLITQDVIKKEPITVEIVKDIETNNSKTDVVKTIKSDKQKSEQGSSFEKAHNIVMTVEAGYSGDRKDNGNYTNCKGERIFIGTNHGIATPTLINADVLPRGNTNKEYKTSPEKIKELFKTSYGKNYEKLCGTDEKTFAEQWKLDMKHIVNPEDIEYKWNQIMRHLSKETALDIYQKDYWTPQGFYKFKSQSIANVLYDACVNQGSGAALSVLKNSMENLGHKAKEIGSWDEFHEKLTPKVNKMNNSETEELFEEIKDERMVKYRQADTWDDHKKGWTDRVENLTFVDGVRDIDIS